LNHTTVPIPELKDPLFLWHWIKGSSSSMKNQLKAFYRGISSLRLDALLLMLFLLYPILNCCLNAVTAPARKKKKGRNFQASVSFVATATVAQSSVTWEEINWKKFKQIIGNGWCFVSN
jgi:hypothetical protein